MPLNSSDLFAKGGAVGICAQDGVDLGGGFRREDEVSARKPGGGEIAAAVAHYGGAAVV